MAETAGQLSAGATQDASATGLPAADIGLIALLVSGWTDLAGAKGGLWRRPIVILKS